MDWQLFAVVVIVAGAVGYLARSTWKSIAGRKSCGSGCGCSAKPATSSNGSAAVIPLEQITLRHRRSVRESNS